MKPFEVYLEPDLGCDGSDLVYMLPTCWATLRRETSNYPSVAAGG